MSSWNISLNDSNMFNESCSFSYRNDYIVASLFMLTSVSGLVAYVPCLVVMIKSLELSSPVYTFMISLGISDCASLIGWIIIGLDTYTHGVVLPKTLITVVLCFLVIGWGSLTIHEAMVAVNRLVAVCFSSKHDILFGQNRMKFLLAVSWFYAICLHALATFIPPNMYYTLQGYYAAWASDTVTLYYTYEDITCCSIVFSICITCYVFIIIKFTKVRKQVTPKLTSTHNNHSSKENKEAMFQFRLALQTAIRCLTFFAYDISYYIVPTYTDNLWAVFICSTYLWCLNNALNPFIYLCFNKQLRKAVRRVLFKKADYQTETGATRPRLANRSKK